MAGRRPERGLLERPVTFWSLVVLLLFAVYGGFRAMAPRPPRARRSASSAAASGAALQPVTKASTSKALWGGKPLQLKKPGSPVAPVVAIAPADAPKGVGLTPEEVAARIQHGCPSLVVFFSTSSQSTQEMFPQLVKLAQWTEAPEVLAFATDQDPSDVDTFLRINGASFDALLLHPAKPGELDTALSEVGIKIGKQLNTPLVAVVGSDCKIRGQWPAIINLGPVAALLHTPEVPKEEPE